MKLSITAVLFASILAVSATESSNEQCTVQAIPAIRCKVIVSEGDGPTANCRSGPGTDFDIVKKIDSGTESLFSCYKKGECIGGNCTWDKLHFEGGSCFLSGTLTDKRCSAASLGDC
ncbi:hypothetical protein V494_06073 [Pseudogymnoascus sp. VKM F-4513 (FW-928)]|nr:hypothetical protein V494_06073 [Pseudogymnoascus sp. VKM F-4513 (FW-928)]